MREEVMESRLRVVKSMLDKALYYLYHFSNDSGKIEEAKEKTQELMNEASKVVCKLYHEQKLKVLEIRREQGEKK